MLIQTGSDTTAIALRAVIYYLCRNPKCMAQVVQEIDRADKEGKLSTPISYKDSTTALPYFNAVLKEAMRIHPSVGFLMERHVPPEGVEINGHVSRSTPVWFVLVSRTGFLPRFPRRDICFTKIN